MGEAARRRAQGFQGRALGQSALAALNDAAGGNAWSLARGGEQATDFLVLDAEGSEVRAGFITNREASETPHRIVAQTLVRRGEPWLTAMVFDPCRTYRSELYLQMGMGAAALAQSALGGERVEEIWHETTSSRWANDEGRFEVLEIRRADADEAAESPGNAVVNADAVGDAEAIVDADTEADPGA